MSLPDALVAVVAGEGALQSLPANQLGVSGPATELQGHVVDIDQLEARSTNDPAEKTTSVLWKGHRSGSMGVQNGGGQGDGHIHVDIANLSSLHKVPRCVAAVAAHHLHNTKWRCVSMLQFVALLLCIVVNSLRSDSCQNDHRRSNTCPDVL